MKCHWLHSLTFHLAPIDGGNNIASVLTLSTPHCRARYKWGCEWQLWHQCKTMLDNILRMPLLETSPCWKCQLVLLHLRIYDDTMLNGQWAFKPDLNTVSRCESTHLITMFIDSIHRCQNCQTLEEKYHNPYQLIYFTH